MSICHTGGTTCSPPPPQVLQRGNHHRPACGGRRDNGLPQTRHGAAQRCCRIQHHSQPGRRGAPVPEEQRPRAGSERAGGCPMQRGPRPGQSRANQDGCFEALYAIDGPVLGESPRQRHMAALQHQGLRAHSWPMPLLAHPSTQQDPTRRRPTPLPSRLSPPSVLAQDPHFTAFSGHRFFFEGYDGAVFSLLSERDHQVGGRASPAGPTHSWQLSLALAHVLSAGMSFCCAGWPLRWLKKGPCPARPARRAHLVFPTQINAHFGSVRGPQAWRGLDHMDDR